MSSGRRSPRNASRAPLTAVSSSPSWSRQLGLTYNGDCAHIAILYWLAPEPRTRGNAMARPERFEISISEKRGLICVSLVVDTLDDGGLPHNRHKPRLAGCELGGSE